MAKQIIAAQASKELILMAGKEESKLSGGQEDMLEEAGTKREQFTFEKLMFHKKFRKE